MTLLLAPRIRARTRRTTSLGVWIAAAFLALTALAAVAGPFLAPYDVDEIDFAAVWAGPSPAHLFGTDQLGRDLFSRMLIGAGETLVGPVVLLLLATALGVAIGVVAAWRGGWVDTVLARLTDVMFAFPGLLFVVLVIAVFGKGRWTAVLALALAYAPVIAKYTRSLALSEIARPYIDAYRAQGLGGAEICLRGVIPNLLPSLVGFLVVQFGEVLMSLATLSYLGFGAQPPSSEWGLMVQEGQAGIVQGQFLPTLVPGAAIALVVVAVNIVGVRVADRLQAKG
ncbi:ABC transporter permease [Leucobacter sp. OLJS4]|uniref:ABC transporter permease n=1 Tax=unclassified Leucobacter TaxID=2621730 RepID=UPI000C183997|nr:MULTISPECIES: ABC transporter permease [unclassified Leucobacter]PII88201.1 ABC transporter permease [Leucobacter sp. OLCALW19]PII88485.1 ABC transporter permease [Leucobacter sp. OLTLW20]PII94209.1 ABC transporter permease [Leucobacter sp. OLAS13]PII98219.1 ABC transporter permease [Leucobacter sp. OLDS2]PII98368.1 ABC transporter permease [Leucobacter sp. OLCS4]